MNAYLKVDVDLTNDYLRRWCSERGIRSVLLEEEQAIEFHGTREQLVEVVKVFFGGDRTLIEAIDY